MKKVKHQSASPGRWGILTVATYLAALFFLKEFEQQKAIAFSIALLPLLPATLFVWHFLRSLHQTDELARQMQLDALAFAFPISVLCMMLLGLCQLVTPLSIEDWSYRHILPCFFIFYAIGFALAKHRYGVADDEETPA